MTLHTKKLNPQAGILINPFDNTTIRIAAIEYTQAYYEESLFPSDTSGFIIDHGDESSSQTKEYAVAWDQIIGNKTFFTISGSYRDRYLPTLADITYEDKFIGTDCILNRILNKYIALSAEYSFLRSDDQVGKRNDHNLRFHLGFVHHNGLFAGLTEVYTNQENEECTITEPFNTSFWITNAEFGYELPRKYGKITLSVENLFDKQFEIVIDPFSLETRLPVRRATIKAEIYF